MRLLTLNTHSLLEENYHEKCNIFINAVKDYEPDVIALQEVNQSKNAQLIDKESNMKADNHGLTLLNLLKKNDVKYYLSWLYVKNAYNLYDEGLAFFSKNPIKHEESITLSKTNDYNNWKTRKAFVVKTNDLFFCNTHMGWWDDSEEPFKNQFDILHDSLKKYKQIYLMGDFNSPDTAKNEGYSYICSKEWNDTYILSQNKDNGYTVKGKIAGWENSHKEHKRIDYIFTNRQENILKSQTIFNGKNYEIVSDHFGVMIDI